MGSWRERFTAGGRAKFGRVREGQGHKPQISAEKVEAIVQATLYEKPPGQAHWSCRSMAKGAGGQQGDGAADLEVARAWLGKHLRFHLHCTPASSSWLTLVERWFRDLTGQAIRRGVFRTVPQLIAAIEAYLKANNTGPKPFI